MLDFVREMSLSSEDLSQRQSDYWIFVLQSYPPHLIEHAFHQWVRKSKHMPVPSEIIEILDGMMESERQEALTSKTENYLAELRETRHQLADAGQLYGDEQYHQLMKKALEILKQVPQPPDPTRLPLLKERLARARQEKALQRKPVAKAEAAPEVIAEHIS